MLPHNVRMLIRALHMLSCMQQEPLHEADALHLGCPACNKAGPDHFDKGLFYTACAEQEPLSMRKVSVINGVRHARTHTQMDIEILEDPCRRSSLALHSRYWMACQGAVTADLPRQSTSAETSGKPHFLTPAAV